MSASRGWQWIISPVAAVAKGAAIKLHLGRAREPIPTMIGTPPSQRGMWPDTVAHARDFSLRYGEEIDLAISQRMVDLGIPRERIGMPDDDRGIEWAAFHPRGTNGGYNSPDGRLVVESGLFNLDLLRKDYGDEAAKLYATSDVASRLDSIIAHEYEEHRHGGSHVEALRHAASTELSITDRAREIGRAMEKGWRGC
jgi:hypothetical protein